MKNAIGVSGSTDPRHRIKYLEVPTSGFLIIGKMEARALLRSASMHLSRLNSPFTARWPHSIDRNQCFRFEPGNFFEQLQQVAVFEIGTADLLLCFIQKSANHTSPSFLAVEQ